MKKGHEIVNCKTCDKVKFLEGVIDKLFKVKVSDGVCDYCEHNIPCLGKDCECYVDGVGLYDSEGKYYDWKWSCMDYDFGTCDKLINTPCCECIKDYQWSGFKWNGKDIEECQEID